MTPEERELVRDLFERLAALEREPRDPDAERLIREGLTRAPNGVYSLVQTVLLQDEGLRAADQRITELEDALAQARSAGPARSDSSFLGDRSARGGKWNTGNVLGGSVPSVGGDRDMGGPQGGGDRPMGVPPAFRRDRGYDDPPPYGQPMQGGQGGGGPWGGPQGGGGYGGGGPARGGGSFLGTAAAVAAGAIGGGLLMGGIQSALGGSKGQATAASGSGAPTPQSGAQAAGAPGELERDAGLHDVGHGGGQRVGATSQADDTATGYSAEDDDSDLDHDDMHDLYDEE